jgi:hypothetical protein
VWTEAEVRALGVRTDIPTAGAILAGISRAESYRAAADGRLPVVILRVGRRQVVTVASVLAALGLDSPGPDDREHLPGHDSPAAGDQPGPGTASGGVLRQLRGVRDGG